MATDERRESNGRHFHMHIFCSLLRLSFSLPQRSRSSTESSRARTPVSVHRLLQPGFFPSHFVANGQCLCAALPPSLFRPWPGYGRRSIAFQAWPDALNHDLMGHSLFLSGCVLPRCHVLVIGDGWGPLLVLEPLSMRQPLASGRVAGFT